MSSKTKKARTQVVADYQAASARVAGRREVETGYPNSPLLTAWQSLGNKALENLTAWRRPSDRYGRKHLPWTETARTIRGEAALTLQGLTLVADTVSRTPIRVNGGAPDYVTTASIRTGDGTVVDVQDRGYVKVTPSPRPGRSSETDYGVNYSAEVDGQRVNGEAYPEIPIAFGALSQLRTEAPPQQAIVPQLLPKFEDPTPANW